jgi:hypothetical protein
VFLFTDSVNFMGISPFMTLQVITDPVLQYSSHLPAIATFSLPPAQQMSVAKSHPELAEFYAHCSQFIKIHFNIIIPFVLGVLTTPYFYYKVPPPKYFNHIFPPCMLFIDA